MGDEVNIYSISGGSRGMQPAQTTHTTKQRPPAVVITQDSDNSLLSVGNQGLLGGSTLSLATGQQGSSRAGSPRHGQPNSRVHPASDGGLLARAGSTFDVSTADLTEYAGWHIPGEGNICSFNYPFFIIRKTVIFSVV